MPTNKTPASKWDVGWRIAAYVSAVILAFIVASTPVSERYSPSAVAPSPDGGVIARVKDFRRDPTRYDLIFIGDSRTYCAIHPDLLDPLLGTSSVNLSAFSHWFPTQYAEFHTIVDYISPTATLVWAIGAQNFSQGGAEAIQLVYPIGWSDAWHLLQLGFSPGDLVDNLTWNSPLASLWAMRHALRSGVFARLDRPIWNPSTIVASAITISSAGHAVAPTSGALADQVARLKQQYGERPDIVSTDVLTDHGRVTSIAQIRKGGTYYRTEIDPEFFRAMQRHRNANKTELPLEVEQRYWNLFIAILDLLRERGIRVVVLAMEEAPNHYGTEAARQVSRRFMNERVRPEIIKRNFRWVTVDFDRLDDSDYFDYNHLNSKGIAKFLPMLGQALRSMLPDAPNASTETHAVR